MVWALERLVLMGYHCPGEWMAGNGLWFVTYFSRATWAEITLVSPLHFSKRTRHWFALLWCIRSSLLDNCLWRHKNGLGYFQIITSTVKFIKGFSFPFRGKEEIIGREIRDFMENNKALENELVEETGVTETELMKYLKESVHLKEDKRKNLFRWYLEKKLSRMESGSIHFIFLSSAAFN